MKIQNINKTYAVMPIKYNSLNNKEGVFIRLNKIHKCLNCGVIIDKHLNFCSEKCKKEDKINYYENNRQDI